MLTRGELHRVVLRRVPVEVWQRSRDWFNGLVREFEIIASGFDIEGDAVPGVLVRFVAEIRGKFSQFTHTEAILDQAVAASEVELDLELQIPQEAGAAASELWDLIERAEAYCRSGQLLTLAPTEEVRTFTQWYLGELTRQIDGQRGLSWPQATRPSE
jgi:hypothetical protein